MVLCDAYRCNGFRNNLELFHIDREFDVKAEYFPLRVNKF